MREILELPYWDVLEINEFLRQQARRASGKPMLKHQQSSHKEMIQRAKNQEKKYFEKKKE